MEKPEEEKIEAKTTKQRKLDLLLPSQNRLILNMMWSQVLKFQSKKNVFLDEVASPQRCKGGGNIFCPAL